MDSVGLQSADTGERRGALASLLYTSVTLKYKISMISTRKNFPSPLESVSWLESCHHNVTYRVIF